MAKEKTVNFVKTLVALAAALGCSRKQLDRWREESDFPKPRADGRYSVAACKKWVKTNGKLIGSGRAVPANLDADAPSGDKSYAELRKEEKGLDVAIKRLELKEKRGEVVRMSEAKEICLKIMQPLARRVKDLPASMALKCNPGDPSHAKAELKTWVEDTLDRIQAACSELRE